MDKFTTCHKCGSQLCYSYIFDDITTYNCMNCGFTTNSLMKLDTEKYKEIYEKLPELYKDLCYTDNDNYVWIPMVINHPKQGIVFVDGSSIDDWCWTAVLEVPIPEEEKFRFPIPGKQGEFYSHKIDMNTKQQFPRDQFVGGLLYIGAIESQPE